MDNNSSSSYVDDGTYRSQSELSRVSKEKEELEIQNKQLIDKHSALLNKYVRKNQPFNFIQFLNFFFFKQDKLESDKQDLQDRLKDMDTAVAQAQENGKTEHVVRTELGFVKRDL